MSGAGSWLGERKGRISAPHFFSTRECDSEAAEVVEGERTEGRRSEGGRDWRLLKKRKIRMMR